MATIRCPNCRESYCVDDDVVGATVECAVCHATFTATASSILLKPIPSSSEAPTTGLSVKKKSLALFFAMGTIIIIQTVLLTVLFSRRGAAGNNICSISNNSQAVAPLPPGTPSELFLKYTEQGELSYVEAVLKQNPALDVNRPRAAGNKTALYIACEKGYADIARFLLGKKADVRICDTEKETFLSGAKFSPLTIASRNGHLSVVKVLLSSGVDKEARDDGDRTALYAAAAGNKPEVVRFLCESNAKVNIIARRNNWSPLSSAVKDGCIEVVKVLLKYGKGIDLEMRVQNNTALFDAVKNNKPDIVRLLCEANAMVNIYGGDDDYWTPLTYAACRGFTDVVKVLVKHGKGIDLEMRNKRGDTPLKVASREYHDDVVEILKKCESEQKERAQSRSVERENVRKQKAHEEAQSSKQQREVEKPMKEFSGQVSRIDDDCVVFVRDFTKSGIYFGAERKVRLDGIKIKDKARARDFVRRRGCGEVRVTYKDKDETGCVKGIIWEDGGAGVKVRNIWSGEVATKSLNDILVDEGSASYDK